MILVEDSESELERSTIKNDQEIGIFVGFITYYYIIMISDSNGIRSLNHLVCKRTLNHLA